MLVSLNIRGKKRHWYYSLWEFVKKKPMDEWLFCVADDDGNVYSKKDYEALRKQGII